MILVRRLACALTLGLASVLVAFVPAASTGTTTAAADGLLEVSAQAFGARSFAAISLGSADPIARAELSVPAGYVVELGQPVGTSVGFVSAILFDVAGTSSPAFADAALVVDDPARHAADPAAQACAPGGYAAVWQATFSVLGQSFTLLVFLDPGSTGAGAAALVLTFCPAWSSPTLPGGVTADRLTIFLTDIVTPATAPGRYTWSAFVTPLLAGSLAPDAARTFELRAITPLPHTLTLRARHDPRAKSVVLTGRLTAVGEPQAGVEISFGATTDAFSEFTFFGPITTNASGAFSIRRHVERTTLFTASAESTVRPCSAPSSAPAGCPAETVSPPRDASAIVKVRDANDPKLAVRVRDQALARRINLTSSDFPPGWETFDTFPVFSCPGFNPKLSDLTVTGELESRTFVSEQAVAASRASIYLSETQARKAFAREAQLALARCLAKELRDAGYTVLQLIRRRSAPLGDETRAFRVVASQREEVVTMDLISFRRGRALVHLGFASLVQPLLIADELAARVAARAGRAR